MPDALPRRENATSGGNNLRSPARRDCLRTGVSRPAASLAWFSRRFRILNIVDDVTRESLAPIPDTSISGRRAARELTMLIETRGKPGMIVSGDGTEFTSNSSLG